MGIYYVIDPKYTNAHSFSEGLAPVETWDPENLARWGFLNVFGEMAIEPLYSEPSIFSEGLAWVNLKINERQGKGYFINSNNKKAFELKEDCYPDRTSFGFTNGLARMTFGPEFDEYMGYINKNGQIVFRAM